jgi:hypothetical protein
MSTVFDGEPILPNTLASVAPTAQPKRRRGTIFLKSLYSILESEDLEAVEEHVLCSGQPKQAALYGRKIN